MPANIPILAIGKTLVVPLHGDLYDQLVKELQDEILSRIERSGARGLILDVSALEFVDSFMARTLNDTAAMSGLMGTRTVVVGITPPVALVLMDLGLTLAQVPTARNMEKGLALLGSLIAADAADASEEAGPSDDE